MVSGNASASGAFQAQHEVWQENLEQEFALIRDIVQTYNYISCLLYTSPSPRDRG